MLNEEGVTSTGTEGYIAGLGVVGISKSCNETEGVEVGSTVAGGNDDIPMVGRLPGIIVDVDGVMRLQIMEPK